MARRRRDHLRASSKLLTAAAVRIDLESKEDAQLQRKVRQNWQLQAWTYRDSIPELRFAIEFMAHCAARMRLFVAALPEVGETGTPIDIHDPTLNVPDLIVQACDNALRDLGNGRLELSKMMKNLSTQWSVAGEGFLLGVMDPMSTIINYSIRSISEIVVNDDEIELREGPMTNQGVLGLVELPPDSLVTRLWNPHPQYRLLADSPMRALLDTCEDLMILRRMIRAIGRNRIAGRGLLMFPTEASLPIFNDDDNSVNGAPFYDQLTNSMITPIRNEGDASAVVPMVTEMAGETIAQVRWLEFTSNFDENASKIRDELLDTLATGLDLPKEVITGMADLNHWTEWAIDANTFRYHVEPHVMELTDVLTVGYLRSYLQTSGLPDVLVEPWVNRILFWHDPTELITPPDLSESAFAAHAVLAISDAALRRYVGFSEADAPLPEEIEIRMVRNTRNWPLNALMAFMHALDPSITIPPITTTGTVPGVQGTDATHVGGVVVPTPPAEAVGDTPALPTPPAASTEIPAAPEITTNGPPAVPSNLTAAGAVYDRRFSYQMASLDRELRATLQMAANDEMKRQLEKLGNRLRTKVAKNEKLRKKIAMTHNEHVAMMLGKDVVLASGIVGAGGQLNVDWSDLKSKFMARVKAAQSRALKLAAAFVGVNGLEAFARAQSQNEDNLERGWAVLEASMNALAANLLYNPDPNVSDEDAVANINPDTMVPTGAVRAALAIAGGDTLSRWTSAPGNSLGVISIPSSVDPSMGGVATGRTIMDTLSSLGATTAAYEWQHGPSENVFDPHLDLDGQEFSSFSDDVLQSDGGWPYVDYYYPGDHEGCLCDAMPLWALSSDSSPDEGDSSE